MKIANLKNYIFLLNFAVFFTAVLSFISSPKLIFPVIVFLLTIFIGEGIFIARNSQMNDRWWNIIIFPCVASVTLIFSLTVLGDDHLIRILSLSTAWLIASFWKKAYLFFHDHRKYRLGSLEYLADYGNIFVVFLLSLCFYGFRDYLNTSFWFLLSGLIIFLALIFYQFFWSNKHDFKTFWPYLTVGTLILTQLAWAISLLPFTFINSATLLTVSFYTVVHLQKLHLQAKLTNEKIRHYLAFIVISFIIIFLSARWL